LFIISVKQFFKFLYQSKLFYVGMNLDENYEAALNSYVKAVAVEFGSMKDYNSDYLIVNFGRCNLGFNK